MAITTYTELQTAIAAWIKRDDMTATIPDFIKMAETVFNLGDGDPDAPGYIPPLRAREMETQTDLTISGGAVAAPSGFLEAIRVLAATSPERLLSYATPEWLSEAYPNGQDADAPDFYTIIGSNFISPASFELTYYTAIPPLASNPTNWLLTKSPNAYLYGSLYQYAFINQNVQLAQTMRQMTMNAIGALQSTDNASRAGTLTMRASTQAW